MDYGAEYPNLTIDNCLSDIYNEVRKAKGTVFGMNILILSANTGEGHNGAARALYEEFRSRGVGCELVDALSLCGEKTSDKISSIYNSMIVKLPHLFGAIYRAGKIYSSTGIKSPVFIANSSQSDKLLNFINENGFTAVVSTHLFPMQTLTYLKKSGKINIPCYGVLTDYTLIPFFREVELDMCFVPHADVLEECVREGMDRRRLAVTGIPVSSGFSSGIDRAQARQLLSITDNRKVYLIMTGGAGCTYALPICNSLLSFNDPNAEIFVLTGKNKDLYNEIRREHRHDSRVHAVSFTDKVYLYMKASDVLISKSGGITCTEAAAAQIPIVHVNAIPGCETKNAELFERNGMSVRATDPANAADLAFSIANDSARSTRMRKCEAECINPHAASDIADAVMRKKRRKSKNA